MYILCPLRYSSDVAQLSITYNHTIIEHILFKIKSLSIIQLLDYFYSVFCSFPFSNHYLLKIISKWFFLIFEIILEGTGTLQERKNHCTHFCNLEYNTYIRVLSFQIEIIFFLFFDRGIKFISWWTGFIYFYSQKLQIKNLTKILESSHTI